MSLNKPIDPKQFYRLIAEYETRYNVTGLSTDLVEGCRICETEIQLRRYLKSRAIDLLRRELRYSELTDELRDQLYVQFNPLDMMVFTEILNELEPLASRMAVLRYQGYKDREIAKLLNLTKGQVQHEFAKLRAFFRVDACQLGIVREEGNGESPP